VRILAWTQTVLLGLLCNSIAQAQSPIPKELEDWQAWVQDGHEFRHCPFFANSDGGSERKRVCAWPGRLSVELNQNGGRFTQTWVSYVEGWVPLPGSLEYWPTAVTVNGVVAAVAAHDGIPQIRVSEGTFAIAGSFAWERRPESLPVPAQTGLVSLSLDGHKVEQAERPDNSVWLGKRHEAEVAQHLDIQVYRLLSDGIPATLNTHLNLQVAGDAREEVLSAVLPQGFEAMSIESELPAHIGTDGRLRLQVRAGSWTVEVVARNAGDLGKISIADGQGSWPKQEVWSYRSDDRLRVAALEGGEGIDPTQANVPQEWRKYPSYRIASGGVLQITERSRGISPQEVNHLALQRELYLDFAHQGFTVIDQISGQMRNGWRLDMRAPYRLMRASIPADNLLVTEADGAALTGVELRAPELSLATVARIAATGGTMPATGWSERFDHVAGVLNLPPGHRLFAAFGADSAPDSWIERWGLLDLFLLSFTTVIALRIFGWIYAVGYICHDCLGASRKSAAGVVDTVGVVGLRVDASSAGGLAAIGGNVGAQHPIGGAARDGGPIFDRTDAFRVIPTACRPGRLRAPRQSARGAVDQADDVTQGDRAVGGAEFRTGTTVRGCGCDRRQAAARTERFNSVTQGTICAGDLGAGRSGCAELALRYVPVQLERPGRYRTNGAFRHFAPVAGGCLACAQRRAIGRIIRAIDSR
jgi:hypothetical protein